jgi:MFS family permease
LTLTGAVSAVHLSDRCRHAVVPGHQRREADPVGALLSIAGMTALVWTVVELPHGGRCHIPDGPADALQEPRLFRSMLLTGAAGVRPRRATADPDAGLAVMATGFAVLASVTDHGGLAVLGAAMALMGAGAGLAMPAASTALMGAVPAEHAGIGSALNDTVQQAGAALGVAVLG